MKTILLCLTALGYFGVFAQNVETINIEQCFEAAKQHAPMLQTYEMYDEILSLEIEAINAENLPLVYLSGKGSYQSDVTEIPIDNPFLVFLHQIMINMALT